MIQIILIMKSYSVVKSCGGGSRTKRFRTILGRMVALSLIVFPLMLRAESPQSISRAKRSAPDERPLWRLLNEGRDAELEKAIRLTRATHAHWKPPGLLISLMKQNEFRLEMENAIKNKDERKIVRLGEAHPGYFSCRHVDWAWELGHARALLKEKSALSGFYRLIPYCGEKDRMATLYKARKWLSDADFGLLLAREQGAKRSEAGEVEFERLRYEFSMKKLRGLTGHGRESGFNRQLSGVSGDIRRYRDSGGALVVAWHFFNEGEVSRASNWFRDVLQWRPGQRDALNGLALCAMKEGHYEEAIELARKLPARSGKKRMLLRDALIGMAREAYRQGRFENAVRLFSEAGHEAELPRYAKSMMAWSHYRMNDAEGAADRFEALYGSAPDDDSAAGIYYSLTKAGRSDERDALGNAAQPDSKLAQLYGEQLYNEGQFLAARRRWPSRYADLGSVADRQGSFYLASRDKVGVDGLSRLRIDYLPILDAGWAAGEAGQMNLRLEHVTLDSGMPQSNAYLGSNSSGKWAYLPVTRVEGIEPRFTWRDERSQTWIAEIGLTPSNGEIHSRPIGDLVREIDGDDGDYSFRLYREPDRDSVLSYTGLRDPYSGIVWGGVERSGVAFSTLRSLGGRWSANGSFTAEALDGSGVSGNAHAGFDSGMSRDLNLSGFKYAALGLSVGLDHYSHNSYEFTLGQGGYFSPQVYWNYGPSFDFMTEEGGQFIVKGHLDFGGEYDRQDAIFSPFAPNGVYPGSQGSGRKYDVQLNGVWRLTSHVQVGGMFAKRYAPQYSDNAAMVFMRFLVEPRSAVLNSDLGESVAESFY